VTHGETTQLTGLLYEADYRGRTEDDYAFTGHLSVNGQDYRVRAYGPQSVRGTSKRRYWLKLEPMAPRDELANAPHVD